MKDNFNSEEFEVSGNHEASIIDDANKLLESCRKLDSEMKEMKSNTDFLLNEYHTNKKWFRPEPGRTTVEDVIKAVFEFGWVCGRNWERDNT